MSAFWRCDVCNREMSTTVAQPELRAYVNDQAIELRVIRSVNGIWNGGNLCDHCLAAAFRDAATTLEATAEPLGCDRCGKPSTHISTPGAFRGCDEHFLATIPTPGDAS